MRARRGEATLRTTFTATCYKCLLLLASFGCCCCCCCLSGFSCFFFVQPTGQTGFWLMAKFATFSRCCSCCCKILFKPSGKRCLHMTSECCLGRPGKETQARRAADFKPKAKTKTNNNNTTTTKSSAGWRLQLGLIHCILLYLFAIYSTILYTWYIC